MQKFETPTLPKLRLERTKQPRGLQNVSLKDGGSITARIRNQKSSSFLPSAPAQPKHQNPPQHRRGYGFTGIVADSQPKTARVVSDSKLTPAPAPPAEPLTARPPTSDKSCPPRTGRHLRELPVELTDSTALNGGGEFPITPSVALKKHRDALSEYEQAEILDYPKIWFLSTASHKLMKPQVRGNVSNHGYDDERADYNVRQGDHIGYRYEIESPLGKGSFGQVVKCFDHKTRSGVALKLIRNKKQFHQQALVEVKLLQYCKDRDPQNQANIVHMEEYFYFRNHVCITFELMSINLYELIKNNNYRGLSIGLIRRFAVQLLTALRVLKSLRIIHCDMKPENILLKSANKSGIKLIDFGSSCFEDERMYTYIQSRFYRSPEVILGLPYDTAIDIWSFGCILAELYTGYPLFPGENEVEQMGCIMEVFEEPPQDLVEMSSRKKMFFDSSGQARIVPNSRGKKRRPGSKDLAHAMHCKDRQFVEFLQGCLRWDPRERFTAEDAIHHEWILEGIPPNAQPQPPTTSRNTKEDESGSKTNRQAQLPSINQKGKHRQPNYKIPSSVATSNGFKGPRPT